MCRRQHLHGENRMREIKFRAWDSIENKMWTPIVGLCGLLMVSNQIGGYVTYDDPQDPLMQYTGLKDKSGVDIYEGDIVSIPIDGEFFNAEISFTIDRDFNGWEITPQDIENGAVIVGNIHENPDLLK